MMTRRKRTSYQLLRLKDELRKRALAEENEEKRQDYWRLYFKAQNAEGAWVEPARKTSQGKIPAGTPTLHIRTFTKNIHALAEFVAADGTR